MCDKCYQCKHIFESIEGKEVNSITVGGNYLWDGISVDGDECFDDMSIKRVVEVIRYNGPHTIWYRSWGDSWDVKEEGKRRINTVYKEHLREIGERV